jgi:ribosomal VAR1-like protein
VTIPLLNFEFKIQKGIYILFNKMLNQKKSGLTVSNINKDKLISYPHSLIIPTEVSATKGIDIKGIQNSALKKLQTAAYFFNNKEHIIKLNLATSNSNSQQHPQIATSTSLPSNVTDGKGANENFKLMKAFVGKPLKSQAQNFYHSKAITYSFIQKNNNYPLLSSTKRIENLLIEFFLSISSLIGRPVFINFQNKLVIRLFVFTALMRRGSLLNRKNNLNNVIATNNLQKSKNKNIRRRSGSLSDRNRISLWLKNSNYINLFIEKISWILSQYLNKKVEFEIIRLEYPFHDSKILSQVLGFNANKYNFRRMWIKLLPLAVIKNPSEDIWYEIEKSEEILEGIKKADLFKPSSYLPPLFSKSGLQSKFINKISNQITKNRFASYLSGINIRLGGRLMTQGMRARYTVQTKQSGSLARAKVEFMERARFTGKNKRGSYSFTVTMSHVIS